MALGTEGQIGSDAFHIIFRIAEHVFRQPDFLPADILLDSYPFHPPEQAGKVSCGYANLAANLAHHYFAVEILENEVLCLFYQFVPFLLPVNIADALLHYR